ncbi:MAG: hypothetical protein Q8880_09975, partial [Bacteroidota bacterium]|nr:hypothetical protein [Bacteroidota bacterium]
YLDGSYLLSKNDVYKLYDNMDIEKTQNQSKHDAIKKKLENFIAINTYVCSKNKIIPDSLNNEIAVNKAEEAKSPEVKSVNKNKSDLSENISNTKPNNKEFNGKFKSIDKQLKWLKENKISYIYNNSGNNKDLKTEYFIVAGSFKKSSNAEGFVEILKGKGMKSEIVFNTELKLYHVYTFKYTDMFTAIKKLHEAQNDEKYNKQALLFIN